MTLKKQLIFLASLIIAIPILCVVFISISNYLHSSKRYMSRNDGLLSHLNRAATAEETDEMVEDEFNFMPPEMDAFLVSEHGQILISTIPEIEAETFMSKEALTNMILDLRGAYFYQFAPHKYDNGKAMLITRIPRKNHINKDIKRPGNFYIPLLIFVAVLVCICVFVLIGISRVLFNSVLQLQTQMERISNGNLEEPVDTSLMPETNEITFITESLEKMRKALLDAQNRKNKFIMGISHDLRTPIAVIKGYTEALSDGVISDTDETKKTYGLIRVKISNLEDMINTLINFVKLENGEIRKTLTPKPITKIIKNFASDAENTVNVFKRRFTSNIDLPNEYLVPYDEQLVNRVFENILSNALRYTSENDEIRICSFEKDGQIFIRISDSGIGISEDDLANIFDMFYRASNSRKEDGMGIGLSVVKNIIETHGWKIEVESEKDKGSCFIITIPLPAQKAQQ